MEDNAAKTARKQKSRCRRTTAGEKSSADRCRIKGEKFVPARSHCAGQSVVSLSVSDRPRRIATEAHVAPGKFVVSKVAEA